MFFLLQRSSFGTMLRILFWKFTIAAVVAWVGICKAVLPSI